MVIIFSTTQIPEINLFICGVHGNSWQISEKGCVHVLHLSLIIILSGARIGAAYNERLKLVTVSIWAPMASWRPASAEGGSCSGGIQ
jgi:hypothetical protein